MHRVLYNGMSDIYAKHSTTLLLTENYKENRVIKDLRKPELQP